MNHRMRILLALALVAATAAPAPAAIDGAGTTAGNFLSVGSGAGVLGMGGATLALPGGLNAVSWNPAALGHVNETEFALSHAGLESQVAQEWAAAGGRVGRTSTRWSLSALYSGQGGFEGRDASGVSTGSFNVSDLAIGAHVARPLGPFVTAGVGAKMVSENLGTTSGSGFTFDAGVLVKSGPVGFGLAAQNLGGRMAYDGASYPFPSNVGLGVSLEQPNGLRLALDANFPKAYYNDVRVGAEWRFHDKVAMRAGYRKELGAASDDRLSGPTFGFGGGIGGMWFDYGYVIPGQGDGQHRVGLTLRPGALHLAPGPLGAQTGDKPAGADTPATGAVASGAPAKPAAPKPATPKPSEPALDSSPPSWRAPKSANEAPQAAALPAAKDNVAAPRSVVPAAPAPQAPVGPPVPAKLETPRTAPAPAPAKVEAPKPAPPASAMKQAASVSANVPAPRPVSVAPAPALAKPVAVEAPKPMALEPAPAVVEAPKSAPVQVALAEPVVTKPAPESPAPARVESPAPVKREAPKSAPAVPAKRPASVKVQANQSLADIAKQWGTSVPAIMMENNMVTDAVKVGQVVKLPKN